MAFSFLLVANLRHVSYLKSNSFVKIFEERRIKEYRWEFDLSTKHITTNDGMSWSVQLWNLANCYDEVSSVQMWLPIMSSQQIISHEI